MWSYALSQHDPSQELLHHHVVIYESENLCVDSRDDEVEQADAETYEFQIVSLDNKQWHFEAGSAEDRDE